MNILFADKFPLPFTHQLEAMGHDINLDPDLGADDLPGAIGDAEILVVRSTRVTADTINAGGSLKMIIRAGAGTNTIDKDTAAKAGVYVCNVPGKNAIAVAELTMGLLIAIDRNIPDNVSEIRQGRWNKKRFSETTGLYGRSIGVVGLGAIGMAVAERAHAFGMHVHIIRKTGRAPDVERRLQQMAVTEVDDLMTLAETCDVLTFHVPAAEGTKDLVSTKLLAAMKMNAILLNTSRGDLVDETALIKAMEEKGIRAGVDVYQNEPGSAQGEFESALAQHPNAYGTHHIGASTAQAQDAVAAGVVEIIDAFGRGDVIHCVNMKI